MVNTNTFSFRIRHEARRLWWKVYFGWRELWRFVFTRIFPIAISCDWCGRLLPIEFAKLPNHLRFWGRRHRQVVLCDACDKRESIWESFYDDDDPYDQDRHPIQCAVCGGEVGESYSTCDCDDGPTEF